MALEHQDVDDHLGAGSGVHAALGQAHRADQVGQAGDVFASGGAGLVHGAGAGHEHAEPAGPQPPDRAGDEVVVQPQPELGDAWVGFDHPVGERRVADRQIEPAAERAAGEVLPAHARLWVDQCGDAGGDRVVLDAGQPRGVAQRFRHQREEQAGAHAGLQHPAGGEAEPLGGAPDGADHRLRRVVGVLSGALQGNIFGGGGGLDQVLADLLPARPEPALAGKRKHVLRQLGGAEADEAQQAFLFPRAGRPALVLQRLGQRDRGDVVARAGGPAAGELAVAGQREVDALLLARERGWGNRLLVSVGLGGGRRDRGGGNGPAEGGAVEQAERVLGGVGHRGGLQDARCRTRARTAHEVSIGMDGIR